MLSCGWCVTCAEMDEARPAWHVSGREMLYIAAGRGFMCGLPPAMPHAYCTAIVFSRTFGDLPCQDGYDHPLFMTG